MLGQREEQEESWHEMREKPRTKSTFVARRTR